jgi:hypothetical protein
VPWRGVPYAAVDLSVFEAKALALALTEHGHSVSERTVQRWKSGTTKPKPQDIRAIRALVGSLDIQKEAAPPDWAERLEAKVDSILERQDVVGETYARQVIEALATPELMEWQQRIAKYLAALPSPSDEAPADSGGAPAPGAGVRRAPEPS